MIMLDEVLALKDSFPPRAPKGDERNNRRRWHGLKFAQAVNRFKREHGKSWREALEEREHAAR